MENDQTQNPTQPVTREKLMHDLKEVVRDAEDLIKSTAGDLGERTKEARARLAQAIDNAKETCQRIEERAVQGAQATDRLVRSHPYESIGVAFSIGLLLGFLIRRR